MKRNWSNFNNLVLCFWSTGSVLNSSKYVMMTVKWYFEAVKTSAATAQFF